MSNWSFSERREAKGMHTEGVNCVFVCVWGNFYLWGGGGTHWDGAFELSCEQGYFYFYLFLTILQTTGRPAHLRLE